MRGDTQRWRAGAPRQRERRGYIPPQPRAAALMLRDGVVAARERIYAAMSYAYIDVQREPDERSMTSIAPPNLL